MPNYCEHRMKVSGEAEEISEFFETCLNGGTGIVFEQIVPMPAELEGTDPGQFYPDVGHISHAGIEAVTRAPYEPRGEKPISVLDRPAMKKAGVANYDKLEKWLERNRPDVLEVGRKCLRAYRETGYWLESDWRTDWWGAHHCDYFRIEDRSETAIEATFATPWAPARGIYREIARQYPALNIRIAVVEEGNEYAYVFTSSNGEVHEEEPELSTALMKEVNGEEPSIDPFYFRVSQLKKAPLTHFPYWPAKAKLGSAVKSYPVYSPPHPGTEMAMTEVQARENFEYFYNTRGERIEHLRDFMKKFGVSLDFSDASKAQLDKWFKIYAAFLYIHETHSSYDTRQPLWTGEFVSLNVVFDLATFIGDFAIQESPFLRWEMNMDIAEGVRTQHHLYQKPVIVGYRRYPRWRFQPTYDVYVMCNALRQRTYLSKKCMLQMGDKELYKRYVTRTLRRVYLDARGEPGGSFRE